MIAVASLFALASMALPLSPVIPVAGPVPEHHVFAVLRDYFPSSSVTIKAGESIRFVDTDPTAGPGHSFTEVVPDESVTPKFDSGIVPPGTFKDVANVSSLPPGKYQFHCVIHEVLKGNLTVE